MAANFLMIVSNHFAFTSLIICICCPLMHLLKTNVLGKTGWAAKASQPTNCLQDPEFSLVALGIGMQFLGQPFFFHHHRNTDVTNNSNTTAMINEEPCWLAASSNDDTSPIYYHRAAVPSITLPLMCPHRPSGVGHRRPSLPLHHDDIPSASSCCRKIGG